MKKIVLFFIANVFSFTLISCNNGANNQQPSTPPVQEQSVDAQQAQPVADSMQAQAAANQGAQSLPDVCTKFLKQHFPDATVSRVKTDNNQNGIEYDVMLNDGTEVDFDTKNQWEKIENKTKGIPAALIPEKIASYVKSHQNLPITKIDKQKAGGYEIELNNGMELYFDMNNNFVHMEMDD